MMRCRSLAEMRLRPRRDLEHGAEPRLEGLPCALQQRALQQRARRQLI